MVSLWFVCLSLCLVIFFGEIEKGGVNKCLQLEVRIVENLTRYATHRWLEVARGAHVGIGMLIGIQTSRCNEHLYLYHQKIIHI